MWFEFCRHPGCENEEFGPDAKKEGWLITVGPDLKKLAYCPEHIPVEKPVEIKQEQEQIRGFDRPEPGSEERFDKRSTQVPWVIHTFWWLVHNLVAHPLIGLIPVKRSFDFHDWTSYKMHGKEPE